MKPGLIIVFVFFVVFPRAVSCQDIAIPDTQAVIAMLDSGDVYEYVAPDMALSWYKKAIAEIHRYASRYHNSDPVTGRRMLDLYSTAHRYAGIVYRRLGRCSEALAFHEISLKYIDVIRADEKRVMTWSNIGLAYHCLGNYEKAVECYYRALHEAEKKSDSIVIARIYTNIGQVHEAQEELEKARDYYKKALDIKLRLSDTTDLDVPYINLGNVTYRMGRLDESELYYQKAKDLFTKNQDIQGLSIISTNLSLIAEKRGQYQKALEYLESALQTDRQLNDTLSIIIDLSTMAKIFSSAGRHSEAIEYLSSARELARIKKMNVQLQQIAFLMSSVYEKWGKNDEALQWLKEYNVIKDTVMSSEKSKRLAELEVLYDTEKKQWQIESLTSEKKISDLELARKNQRLRLLLIIIGIIVAGLSGIGVLAFRLNRTSRARKIANEQLQQRNEEVLHKNTEILAQRDEIDKQKQEIVKLYGEVTDSIVYAKRIQQATLPPPVELDLAFPAHFVIYRPRDIVGGDFYFVHSVNDHVVLAIGDCTGHGVPGGFMSMMGMAFLREIVNAETAADPALILNRMRERVIASLQQYHPGDCSDNRQAYNDIKVKDGMDMGIVSLNRKTGKVLFSGANNSIIIVSNGQATELKGSKMPVSVYVRMDHFENQEIAMNDDTCLYLSSDGFYDQFGGPSGKKYGRSRFASLLGQIAGKPMNAQKKELEEEFLAWKGDHEQTDDVTVLGIKIDRN